MLLAPMLARQVGRMRSGSNFSRALRQSARTTFTRQVSVAPLGIDQHGINEELVHALAYINGKWVDSSTHDAFPVLDPGTGELLTSVANCTREDTQEAIAAADAAFRGHWRNTLAKERSVILRKWSELMLENAEDLAKIMTLECGKPLAESRGEVAYAASFLEWFAEEGRRANGSIMPQNQHGRRLLTIKQPVGVAAAITPWNFPAAMITRKVGPALAAGCTIVCKPAEDTPLTALALAALGEQAGVPAGVFNVIPSSRAHSITNGTELCENEIVRKLSFTGSTGVGKTLYKLCSSNVKRISLELGGNAPFIVFSDADISAAVEGAIASKYRNAGQTCVCTNRMFVHADVMDEFSSALAEAVSGMKIGHGLEDGVQIGPLINTAGLEKVQHHVDDAVAKGAKVICGGSRNLDVGGEGGHFFNPTVLANADPSMICVSEETFGPLAPLISFTEEEEVLRMANDSNAGLAAYFYTKDLGRAWRVSEALEYGMVAVNEGILSTEVAPFGGVKESGIGREGASIGLDEYMETKYICLGGIGS